MSDPFVAEIRIFSCNFAPYGWATCDGQILPISQNPALFSILGTIYGGNGTSNFALPNLQGNVPLFWGQGNSLSYYDIGQIGGSTTVTLLQSEMPAHSHPLKAVPIAGDVNAPRPTVSLARSANATAYQTNTTQNLVQMSTSTVGQSGNNLPHNNMQPYLALNFCIALRGVFPPRS